MHGLRDGVHAMAAAHAFDEKYNHGGSCKRVRGRRPPTGAVSPRAARCARRCVHGPTRGAALRPRASPGMSLETRFFLAAQLVTGRPGTLAYRRTPSRSTAPMSTTPRASGATPRLDWSIPVDG